MKKSHPPDYTLIAKNIKQSRCEMGYTQEHLAQMIRVNPSHISNIENHRTRVSLTTLLSICKALNMTIDSMLMDNYISSGIPLQNAVISELCKCPPRLQKLALDIIILLNSSVEVSEMEKETEMA